MNSHSEDEHASGKNEDSKKRKKRKLLNALSIPENPPILIPLLEKKPTDLFFGFSSQLTVWQKILKVIHALPIHQYTHIYLDSHGIRFELHEIGIHFQLSFMIPFQSSYFTRFSLAPDEFQPPIELIVPSMSFGVQFVNQIDVVYFVLNSERIFSIAGYDKVEGSFMEAEIEPVILPQLSQTSCMIYRDEGLNYYFSQEFQVDLKTLESRVNAGYKHLDQVMLSLKNNQLAVGLCNSTLNKASIRMELPIIISEASKHVVWSATFEKTIFNQVLKRKGLGPVLKVGIQFNENESAAGEKEELPRWVRFKMPLGEDGEELVMYLYPCK